MKWDHDEVVVIVVLQLFLMSAMAFAYYLVPFLKFYLLK